MTHDRPVWLKRPSTIFLDCPLWLKWPFSLAQDRPLLDGPSTFARLINSRAVYFHPFGPSTLDPTRFCPFDCPVSSLQTIQGLSFGPSTFDFRLVHTRKLSNLSHFDRPVLNLTVHFQSLGSTSLTTIDRTLWLLAVHGTRPFKTWLLWCIIQLILGARKRTHK